MQPNLVAGALAAVVLKQRHATQQQIVCGAALSSMMPGPLGMLLPLVLVKQQGGAPGAAIEVVRVPQLGGNGEASALKHLSGIGLVGRVSPVAGDFKLPAGEVVGTDPLADTLLPKGSTVVVYVNTPNGDGGSGSGSGNGSGSVQGASESKTGRGTGPLALKG